MDNFHGLAKVVAEKGGYAFKQATKSLQLTYGKLKQSGCAFTSGGNLPCDQVIHTTVPKWDYENPYSSQQMLKNTILNILQMAMHLNAKIIAMPPIGAGGVGFTLDMMARIIIETCTNWASLKDTGQVTKIQICILDQPTDEAFRKTFNQFLVEV